MSKRSVSEFTEDFYAFESQIDVFSTEVQGYPFWEFVRYEVYYFLHERLADVDQAAKEPTKRKIGKFLKELAILPILWAKYAVQKRRYDLIFINVDRDYLIEGEFRNVYTYHFVEECAKTFSVLVMDPSPLTTPVSGRYPCDVLKSRMFTAIDKIHEKRYRLSSEESDAIRALADRLGDFFALPDSMMSALGQIIKQRYVYNVIQYRRFRSIFSKISTKCILNNNGNAQGIYYAAKQNQIPAVDIQHCLISNLNLLYWYPKHTLKRPSTSAVVAPSHVFTWGEFWHPHIQLPSTLVSIGYPYFEFQKRKQLQKTVGRDKTIIVLSGPFSRTKFSEIALSLAQRLSDHRIIYKLHPEEYGTWQTVYSKAIQETANIQFIDSNSQSLYELFSVSAYQIGSSSTALVEGMAMGLKTFVVRHGWFEEMERCFKGHVSFVDTGADIASAISNPENGSGGPSAMVFEPNAQSNAVKALKTILRDQSPFGSMSR